MVTPTSCHGDTTWFSFLKAQRSHASNVTYFVTRIATRRWNLVPSNAQDIIVQATKNLYTGNMTGFLYDHNGYDDAYAACQKEYASSHVCTSHEIGVLSQYNALLPLKATVRFASLIFTPIEYVYQSSTDCYGFTSSMGGNYSQCVYQQTAPPGPLQLEVCDCKEKLPLACCTVVAPPAPSQLLQPTAT
eukprot:g81701.t1